MSESTPPEGGEGGDELPPEGDGESPPEGEGDVDKDGAEVGTEGDGGGGEESAGADKGEIQAIDLTGRERQLRAAVGAMTRIAALFSRCLRKGMPFLTRYRAQVVPGEVTVVNGGVSSLEVPTFSVGLSSPDGLGWATITIDRQIIAMLLEAAMGGRGAFWETPVEAPITSAQRALLLRVMDGFARDLAQTVQAEVGIELHPTGVIETAADAARGTDALTVPCNLEGLPTAAIIQLSIGAQALQAAAREHENDSTSKGDARIAQGLMEVPLQLVVELGRLTMDVRRVLRLNVGDVLRLTTATDDPVSVCIGGVTKFAGAPIISRGQLSVEVRGRHET